MRWALVVLGALVATHASAADVRLGIGVGAASDMPDRLSKAYTKFGWGPSLQIPVTIGLTRATRLRFTFRGEFGTGSDRVSWAVQVDDRVERFRDDDHWAMLIGGSLTAGLDVLVPADIPVVPYLGGDLGGAWVGTYHSFGGDSLVLLDPAVNDLENPRNVDPYTSQFTGIVGVRLGLEVPIGDRLALWGESGYSVAFVSARPLRKSPAELDARREPFGWNALRAGLGISFSL